jgi:hypothetical protein
VHPGVGRIELHQRLAGLHQVGVVRHDRLTVPPICA